MRVLGVDPGLTRCGVGVVEGRTGRALSLVHVEVLRTPAEEKLERRLLALWWWWNGSSPSTTSGL
jgi:crossover junction endodeoxyribonuclease RuvC